MFKKIIKKLFYTKNKKMLNRMNKIIKQINFLEKKIEKLNDDQLSNQTVLFRKRLKNKENINNLLPESFATVREVIKRIFGIRLFDVQILGGIVLHECSIAEMKTGEGKTLTSTLPAYLNALTKKGVHIVTANDYLAKRDSKNNKPLFNFLGLTTGITLPNISIKEKRIAYSSDITYGTNNEYGFDYLRDNMVLNQYDKVQRKLNYAIIDEVDSILIDEARTPLVISGPSEDSSILYEKINKMIPSLILQKKEDSEFFKGNGHFFIDEKNRQVDLTENGMIFIEKLMIKNKIIKKKESLYSSKNIILMQYIISALKAHVLFIKNIDYIVKNKMIIIVDEHTGRTMHGRRWSDGLHQAIEAKENVPIQNEYQTLASITFQNYFRLYKKLSGMTGTAKTEAFEFNSIYKLDTIVVPTNCPMIRKDMPDLVYITEKEKIKAIIKDILYCYKKNQPVLVGTISIEKSEIISKKLKKINIPHKVLNAKFHSKEAEIISQAGKLKSVTIATNMAGRGTDIVLGGNYKNEISLLKKENNFLKNSIKYKYIKQYNKVISIGGLHVIGTERHESRRIDNQLRGRSGRQGDPGSSRFYLSMEDPLMRMFTSEKIIKFMKKLGMKEGEAIEHPLVTKAIANAQAKVENRNFEMRKELLEYDDIANDQRLSIYKQRNELLKSKNIKKIIDNIYEDVILFLFNLYIPKKCKKNNWKINSLQKKIKNNFNIKIPIKKWINDKYIKRKELFIKILNLIKKFKKNWKHNKYIHDLEKKIMLKVIDDYWKDHLSAIDYLRQGIHLRGYAQKDPKQEYKIESFKMFNKMLNLLKCEIISKLSIIQKNLSKKTNNKNINKKEKTLINNIFFYKNKNLNIKRNDLCPCGSNKKFKRCHGQIY
ncbi:preprotein translocase subunit SecA [Sodalis-like secondary symbiont of Drepanosiphum platanoidis]|uniref:preprotein translocase subunit SecA n=1 Tax=Sodalis-like secondary symbiont of Drepanosiphum platanoidis TaxID=2994493 RepID=UPI003464DB37